MVGSDALIYRLVFNLVENGSKYNRPGGAVRVTLRQERQNACLLYTSGQADNGVGAGSVVLVQREGTGRGFNGNIGGAAGGISDAVQGEACLLYTSSFLAGKGENIVNP